MKLKYRLLLATGVGALLYFLVQKSSKHTEEKMICLPREKSNLDEQLETSMQ